MRFFLALAITVLAACPSNDPIAPDAAIPSDARLLGDFYGEPCDPPSTNGFVSTCRDLPYPKAYCTPIGICRPFCHSVRALGTEGSRNCRDVGGVETWAFEDGARVCYCDPPR